MTIFFNNLGRLCLNMSKEELNEFKVSAVFQNRLAIALKGEKESRSEIANEIGISKDILIRALNTGVIPGTRSLIILKRKSRKRFGNESRNLKKKKAYPIVKSPTH